MASTADNIFKQLDALGVVELAQLRDKITDEWGVTAVQQVVQPGAPAVATEEQTEFAVMLVSVGDNRLEVIKQIRALTGLSLKDAKERVDLAPVVVKVGLSHEDADILRSKLEAAGATAEIE